MEALPANHVTVAQAAKTLGVTAGRVRQLILSGDLPSISVHARLRLIPAAAIRQFAAIDRPDGKNRPKIKYRGLGKKS